MSQSSEEGLSLCAEAVRGSSPFEHSVGLRGPSTSTHSPWLTRGYGKKAR